MKKRVIKLLMGVMLLGTVVTGYDIKSCAEIDDGDIVYYNSWELDMSIERRKRESEAQGWTVYSGREEEARANAAKKAETKKEVTPKCNHTYEATVIKEADCANEGTVEYTCTQCKNKYKEAIPKSETHKYEESVTKEPTCIETGEKTYTCEVCGDSYTEEMPANGHDLKTEVVVEPGCTAKGEEKTYCTKCSEVSTKELEALGHIEGDWIITKEHTMFGNGEQIKKCTVCDELLESEVIPSTYPIYYLYIGIGIAIILLFAVAGTIIIRKKANIFMK